MSCFGFMFWCIDEIRELFYLSVKLVLMVVFIALFSLSIALNVVLIVVIKNNDQKVELNKLKIENLTMKRQAEVNRLYAKEIKSIKKERETIYLGIEEAGTNEEILNIISDIIDYNNFLVSDDNTK